MATQTRNTEQLIAEASPERSGNRFGTFGGVFTPSILTIFGVIMFMRAGWVTGQAGVIWALWILAISKLITTLTAFSVSAICTNTRVRGGGAYFLISRTLGPEFGGTIGVALFLAQSLSVPFYILGFVEALVRTYPTLNPHFLVIALATAILLFGVTWVGAGWAIKIQYVIMAAMGLSILAFMSGLLGDFSAENLQENMEPAQQARFWTIFAVYFPAVTGIMAGLNMSGDLENPARSIPRGTFAAVAVGLIVYALQVVVMGGSAPREALIDRPYETLRDNAILGAGFLVAAGVYCATLSSAIGSFMGAPRILQALSRDELIPFLKPFATGAGKGDEPRRALILTMVITFAVLVLAGSGSGGDAFNMVAGIVTMFFLFTYGMVNLAAFVESFGMNPSFRPRFRVYHWSMALLGTLGCAWAAVLIDAKSALAAAIAVSGIYLFIRRRVLNITFGDARRGFIYARVRQGLLGLSQMPMHPKNWRPTQLVLSGNPASRLTLVQYAAWFECRRGILSLAEFVVRKPEHDDLKSEYEGTLQRLQSFVKEHELQAFPEVVVVDDFDSGVSVFLQSHSLGPIKPNIVMLGWSHLKERAASFLRILQTVTQLGKSLLVLSDRGLPPETGKHRIDLWWRGQKNGSLMVVLAHMLAQNSTWKNAEIRVLRVVGDEGRHDQAYEALRTLIDAARVEATVEVIVSTDTFEKVLHRTSHDATVVFLGMLITDDMAPSHFQERYQGLLDGLPTTILVASSGEADLLA